MVNSDTGTSAFNFLIKLAPGRPESQSKPGIQNGLPRTMLQEFRRISAAISGQGIVPCSPNHLPKGFEDVTHLAVGQNRWYHFGVGAPPILVYSGDWNVHWGATRALTSHIWEGLWRPWWTKPSPSSAAGGCQISEPSPRLWDPQAMSGSACGRGSSFLGRAKNEFEWKSVCLQRVFFWF